MPSMWRLGGHLGSSVSALVDGQLDAETTERAWEHVMSCIPCRRLVEHEGWVKRQLAQVAGTSAPDAPSDRFVGALRNLDASTLEASDAWAETSRLEQRSRTRRRAGIAIVGAGSVSAAVLGISTLTASPMGVGGAGAPASSIGGSSTSSSTPTPALVAPAGSVHGRLRGWTVGSGDDGVVRAHAVGDRR